MMIPNKLKKLKFKKRFSEVKIQFNSEKQFDVRSGQTNIKTL